MVAPHNVGEPVRSFVRVPGEGRAAKALCWDLSRSSSMVAAVAPLQLPPSLPPPQPPLLPPSAPVGQDPAGPSTPDQKQVPPASSPSLTKSKQQLPQPLPQQGAVGTPNGGKRLREEEEEQQGWKKISRRLKVARTTAAAEGMPLPVTGSALPRPGPEEEVQWLRQQCRRLQQENEDLQQRLGQLYRLLKDKERRMSLVRQLDMLELACDKAALPRPTPRGWPAGTSAPHRGSYLSHYPSHGTVEASSPHNQDHSEKVASGVGPPRQQL